MLIDISHFQGNVNWALAKNDADGFYIKITEGSSYSDPMWSSYYTSATSVGKPVGAYHFADLGDPVAEANHFADIYLSRTWQLRPMLDIETAGSTASWISRFRAQFRARVGHPHFRVYTSYSLVTGVLNPAAWVDADTDLWIARYNNTLGWNHPQLVLWQNSSVARLAGFVGSVDIDQYMNGWTPAADLEAGFFMALSDADQLQLRNDAHQALNQLYGPWPQLGNKSMVDALAAILAQVNALQVALPAQAASIEDVVTRFVQTSATNMENDLKAAIAAAPAGQVDVNALAPVLAQALLNAGLAHAEVVALGSALSKA